MATLTIDTQHEPKEVLAAASRFLAELAGENSSLLMAKPEKVIEKETIPLGNVDTVTAQVGSTGTETSEPAGAATVNTPELDGTGRAWDERVDSGNHKMKADGTWQARKNVDKAERARIIAEINAAASGASLGEPASGATQTEAGTVAPNSQGAVVTPIVESPSNTPDPDVIFGNQQADITGNDPVVLTWPEVLQRLTKAQNAGTLDQATVKLFLDENSVANMPLMSNRADLFPAFVERLGI